MSLTKNVITATLFLLFCVASYYTVDFVDVFDKEKVDLVKWRTLASDLWKVFLQLSIQYWFVSSSYVLSGVRYCSTCASRNNRSK